MKAVKNFYWGGKWYKIGDEAPEDCPAFLVEGKVVPEKVTKTVSTGSKKADPVKEDKNGAPETEDKAPKKRGRKKSK